jgi:thioredoxin-related protein
MDGAKTKVAQLKGRTDRLIAIFLFVVLIFAVYSNLQLKKRISSNQEHAYTSTDFLELQIQAVQYAARFWGKRFPAHRLVEVMSKKEISTRFNKKTIVLLFDSNDCYSCLNHEFKLLQKIYEAFSQQSKFDVVAIGSSPAESELLVIRKVNRAHFPLYYDVNQVCAKDLNAKSLPLVLLIDPDENKILNAYKPIPDHGLYSEVYLNGIVRLLVQQ